MPNNPGINVPVPNDHVKVTFAAGDHGSFAQGAATSCYVPKGKPADLTSYAPKPAAESGYIFTGWNKDLSSSFSEDTVITAKYEKAGVVTTDPAGYPASKVKITFKNGEHGTISGNAVFYVDKNLSVDLTQNAKSAAANIKADAGYDFIGWDKNLSGKFSEDTDITAQYGRSGNVTPQQDEVTVTFKAGEGITLKGRTSFVVKKGSPVRLNAPAYEESAGYIFTGWSGSLSGPFDDDTVITAQSYKLKKVEPADPASEPPSGYVRITFKGGEHGQLRGIFAVDVVKGVTVDLAGNLPEVIPEKGYKLSGWSLKTKRVFDNPADITAQYEKLGAQTAAIAKAIYVNASKIKTVGNFRKRQMTISWTKSKQATDYRVAYRKAGKSKWIQRSTKGKSKYVLKKLKVRGLYEFKVKGIRKAGGKTIESKWSKVSYRYLSNTKIRKLRVGRRSVALSLRKAKNAYGYRVIYSLSRSKSKAKAKTFKGWKRVNLKLKKLRKGKRYYVWVMPIKKYKGRTYIGLSTSGKRTKKIK